MPRKSADRSTGGSLCYLRRGLGQPVRSTRGLAHYLSARGQQPIQSLYQAARPCRPRAQPTREASDLRHTKNPLLNFQRAPKIGHAPPESGRPPAHDSGLRDFYHPAIEHRRKTEGEPFKKSRPHLYVRFSRKNYMLFWTTRPLPLSVPNPAFEYTGQPRLSARSREVWAQFGRQGVAFDSSIIHSIVLDEYLRAIRHGQNPLESARARLSDQRNTDT
jgi:hypothetical protein